MEGAGEGDIEICLPKLLHTELACLRVIKRVILEGNHNTIIASFAYLSLWTIWVTKGEVIRVNELVQRKDRHI